MSPSLLRPEKEICLAAVTENDNQRGGQYFRRCWIPSPIINKQFQEQIVENDADKNNGEVSDQLCPFFKARFLEYNVTVEIKPGRLAETEGKHHRRNMRTQRKGADNNILLVKHNVIGK